MKTRFELRLTALSLVLAASGFETGIPILDFVSIIFAAIGFGVALGQLTAGTSQDALGPSPGAFAEGPRGPIADSCKEAPSQPSLTPSRVAPDTSTPPPLLYGSTRQVPGALCRQWAGTYVRFPKTTERRWNTIVALRTLRPLTTGSRHRKLNFRRRDG